MDSFLLEIHLSRPAATLSLPGSESRGPWLLPPASGPQRPPPVPADTRSVARTMQSQRCQGGTRLLVPRCPCMGSGFPDSGTGRARRGRRRGCGPALELPTLSRFPLLNAAAPKRKRCRPGWGM